MMESDPLMKFSSTKPLSYGNDVTKWKELETINNAQNVGLQFFKLSARRKCILVFCALVEFYSGCAFSIMAPFYPREAERKGMDATSIGFIFSVYELVIFITSPIIGINLTRIGSKFVFLSGILTGGICTILFGTLNMCPPHQPFIVLSFATRTIQALGFSSYVTASFAIVSSEFPKNVSIAFGILQTAVGTGLMLGPVIGGVLYEIGGFGLPFYFMGTVVVLNGVFVWYFLPDPNEPATRNDKNSIFSLVCNPMVCIPMLSICTAALGLTFLEPTLAKHLEPFGLTTVVVSLFFVIAPLVNSITSPIWGYLTDTKNILGPILVLGFIFYSFGFLLIGPSPILISLPFEIWLVVIGLIFVGVTFAGILITSMKCMVIGALQQGFEDNLDTYGIIAGLFNCMYTMGGFVGPMLGGILSEKFGASFGFTVVGLIAACMAVVTGSFFVIRRYRR